jgi:cell division protein FtsQ
VDTKRTIRKVLFVAMWLVIGSGMLMLLIAAMDKQKKELCKGYEVKIKAEKTGLYFVDQEGIGKLLKASVKGDIKGKVKAGFNLLEMEKALEKNVWIEDAQLYFDNHAVLHISVKEREPVARLFTVGGKSFYMDAGNHFMPLSEKTIAKVPVFTGFPDKKSIKDTALLNGVNSLARYISTHPFWSSQVAQIDINGDCGAGCWEFEMVPVVGRHVVKLGDGNNIDHKFQRLFAFYEQVLNRTGFDHYKTIDVRFEGQVVGGKGDSPKTDSVKLAKSVQQMLMEANQVFKDTATLNN